MPAGRQRSDRTRSRLGPATPAGRRVPGQPRAGAADDGPGADSGPGAGLGPPADPETAARQICLRLLAVSPRTRAQLAGALRRRGVPEQAAETVLGRFTEAGLIDDPAFARAWVESRHHSRGLSRRTLSAELRQRGVADDDVHDAIETLAPDQEVATARLLVERRLAATRGQPPMVRIRKLMSTLARKGYGAGLSYRIVREALEHEGAEFPEDLPEPDEPGPDADEPRLAASSCPGPACPAGPSQPASPI